MRYLYIRHNASIMAMSIICPPEGPLDYVSYRSVLYSYHCCCDRRIQHTNRALLCLEELQRRSPAPLGKCAARSSKRYHECELTSQALVPDSHLGLFAEAPNLVARSASLLLWRPWREREKEQCLWLA